MNTSSHVPRNEISSLIKEQRQLKATEVKLKSMIEKINNQLNQLLVEELQLKSRELDQGFAPSSKSSESVKSEPVPSASSDQINKQELNLDVRQRQSLLQSLEESEEDDDE